MSTKHEIGRRGFITGLAAAPLALASGCSQSEPPTYGNLLRMGDLVTYKAQRLLLPRQSLAREYQPSDISNAPATGSTNPGDENAYAFHPQHGPSFANLHKNGFADWRLLVEGAVARPGTYSLADLKAMPARTQITRHTCEEGWSAIGQWTGLPLHVLLDHVGMLPTARYVQFLAYDYFADGIDLYDALHPQTILAYGMNGRNLPLSHGAPIRLRVERQLGYKNMKFIRKIVVTEHFDDHGACGMPQNGWSWYAGI